MRLCVLQLDNLNDMRWLKPQSRRTRLATDVDDGLRLRDAGFEDSVIRNESLRDAIDGTGDLGSDAAPLACNEDCQLRSSTGLCGASSELMDQNRRGRSGGNNRCCVAWKRAAGLLG